MIESANDMAERNNAMPALEMRAKIRHQPTNGLMFILPLPSLQTIGSIHLPKTSVRPVFEGHVISTDNNAFDVGDLVVWNPHAETRLKIDGSTEFCVVTPTEVIGVIKVSALQPPAVAMSASLRVLIKTEAKEKHQPYHDYANTSSRNSLPLPRSFDALPESKEVGSVGTGQTEEVRKLGAADRSSRDG